MESETVDDWRDLKLMGTIAKKINHFIHMCSFMFFSFTCLYVLSLFVSRSRIFLFFLCLVKNKNHARNLPYFFILSFIL